MAAQENYLLESQVFDMPMNAKGSIFLDVVWLDVRRLFGGL